MRVNLLSVILFLLHYSSVAQNDTPLIFNTIKMKVENKKYDDALVILKKYISEENYSDSIAVELYLQLSTIYDLKFDRDNAIHVLLTAVERYPDNFVLNREIAYLSTNSAEYNLAETFAQNALALAKNKNDSIQIYYIQTTSFIHQIMADDAIALSNKMLQMDSSELGCLANIALAYSIKKEPKKAIEIMYTYLEKDTSSNWLGYNNIALYYLEDQNYDSAKVYFERSIELAPDCAFCYSNLGFCYHNLGDYTSAIKYYNISIELNPKNSWVYKNKGITYISLNMKEEACKYFNLSKNLGYEEFYGTEVNELLHTHCR